MSELIGIKFKNAAKIYGFKAEEIDISKGDSVVVESEMGMSLGRVVVTDFDMNTEGREIKPIIRKATEEDIDKDKENNTYREEAKKFCNERIIARGLDMKLIDTDTTLDRKRFIFYFVAEGRIDFRELVKDLASRFRTRIELRQIGVRDAAMITGGMGICGREFCCKTFLPGFLPISIKMAKQQDLVLNTAKLSGTCGRLMCCLHYEHEKGAERRARIEREAEERELKEKEEVLIKLEEERTAKALVVDAATPELSAKPSVNVEQPKDAKEPKEEGRNKRRGPRRRRRRSKQGPNVAKDASATQSATQSGAQGSAPESVKPGSGPQESGAKGPQKAEKPSGKPRRRRRRSRRGKKKPE